MPLHSLSLNNILRASSVHPSPLLGTTLSSPTLINELESLQRTLEKMPPLKILLKSLSRNTSEKKDLLMLKRPLNILTLYKGYLLTNANTPWLFQLPRNQSPLHQNVPYRIISKLGNVLTVNNSDTSSRNVGISNLNAPIVVFLDMRSFVAKEKESSWRRTKKSLTG